MKLSVVIATHDRDTLVGGAIESALEQRLTPHETIVVDDGSTDGTRDVIARFGASVLPIYQENRGVATARNVGAARASGEWIAFLDSDDTWDPGHLERIAGAIERTRGRAGLYFSDTILPGGPDGSSLWAQCGFRIRGPFELVDFGSAWACLARQPMMVQSSVVNAAAFEEVGGFRTDLVVREDTHLFLKLCIGRPVCAVAGTGARMGEMGGEGRLTTRFDADTIEYREATRLLYTDILRGDYSLEPTQRRELASRLAAAHLRLARAALSAAELSGMGAASAHVARAFVTRPRRVFQAIARRCGLGR